MDAFCTQCGVSKQGPIWRVNDEPDDLPFCSETCGKLYLSLYKKSDPVNHPSHYTSHPSGIECIQITEHMNFTLGNALKYIWRADLKNGTEDLKKAIWYLNRELEKRTS